MRPHKVIVSVASLCFLLAFPSLRVWAQFSSGFEGTISDPSGAVVPTASVTIKNVATGVTASVETSSAGYYRVISLPPGGYDITATASGFKTTVYQKVNAQLGEIKTVNIVLELGKETSEVTVTSEPPPVETSEGRVSAIIEETKVKELPLTGRNFYTLVVLTPGVTGLPTSSYQFGETGDIFTAQYGVSLNANGQGAQANYFGVDGTSTNNPVRAGVTNLNPNAESIQEVRISVNNFAADYGRNSSVSVNVVSKQGTNDLHGSASWFHTNNVLQSRTHFIPEIPVNRRNEAAWGLGGPIRKNRTFFFGSMDILRSGVTSAFPAEVATPDFISFMQQAHPNNISTQLWTQYPAALQTVRNFKTAGNMTGTDCATQVSPSSLIPSPVGPVPCNLGVTGEGDFVTVLPRNGLQWNARIDHNFNNSKDRLYGNFYRTTLDHTLFDAPSVYPAFTKPWFEYSLLFNLNETHTFSPTVINEMAFGSMRTWGDDICDPCEVPGISVQGMAGMGVGWGPAVFSQNTFEWRDVLAFIQGSHNLKAGIQVQHIQNNAPFGTLQTRPNFSFLNVFDFANDQPFAETMIGIDPRSGQWVNPSNAYWADRDTSVSLFIHDDWKVKPNLTLNLGLRWERFGCPQFKGVGPNNNATKGFVFRGGNDFQSRIADAKVDFIPCVWMSTDQNNFAPRFGFAWDPTNQGKTSIRGGAGVFYNRVSTSTYQDLRLNLPTVADVSASIFTPPAVPVYGLGASGVEPFGFPPVTGIQVGLDEKNGLLAGRANQLGVEPHMRTPYALNWFLGVQHAFANNWVLETSYIGSVGRKQIMGFDVNRFAGDLIQNNGVLTGLNHSFGALNYAQALGNSFYTGGTVALKKRFSRGFSFDAAYTFGKAIGSGDSGGGGFWTQVSVADIADLRRERGLASFDVRQRLSFSTIWYLPRPRTGSAWLDGLLGGWQVANVTILQSGTPFSVFCSTPFIPVRNTQDVIVGNAGCDYNADGYNYDYPNTPAFGNFKSGSRSDYLQGLFSAADFPAPPLGSQGDLGRNTFIGPGYANTDFSVMKNMKIPWFLGQEGANLQFRAEFFNLFNRVNLGKLMETWRVHFSEGPPHNLDQGSSNLV